MIGMTGEKLRKEMEKFEIKTDKEVKKMKPRKLTTEERKYAKQRIAVIAKSKTAEVNRKYPLEEGIGKKELWKLVVAKKVKPIPHAYERSRWDRPDLEDMYDFSKYTDKVKKQNKTARAARDVLTDQITRESMNIRDRLLVCDAETGYKLIKGFEKFKPVKKRVK